MDFLSAFLATGDPNNPLDNPALQLLPTLSLLVSFSPLLPRTGTPIPPFVSQEEAAVVVKERIHRLERRTGRPVQFDNDGFIRQSKRLRWLLVIGTAEMLGWSVFAGVTFDWAKGGITALVWVSEPARVEVAKCRCKADLLCPSTLSQLALALRVLLQPPQTPPLSLLVTVVLLLLSSLCNLLQYLPNLAAPKSGLPVAPLLFHAIDLALTSSQLSIILAMPMAAGGLEANVDRAERERLQAGVVVEEQEDIGENYEVSKLQRSQGATQRLTHACSSSAINSFVLQHPKTTAPSPRL